MATITGKRFQMTDGAASPINLFPYTVSEAVYGLNNSISNAISSALSAISLSTYAGSSAIGSSVQPVYYNGSALVACNLSQTYAPYNSAGYLPLTGGTLHNSSRNFLYISSSDTDGPFVSFNVGDNTVGFIGSRASFTWLGCSANRLFLDNTDASLRVGSDSVNYAVFHSGNSNLSTVPWDCSTLTATGVGRFGSPAEGVIISIYGNTIDGFSWDYTTPKNLHLNYSSTGNVSLCFGGGYVGIGTVSPAQKLHVEGGVYASNGYRTATSEPLGLFKGSDITGGMTANDGALYYSGHTLGVWANVLKVFATIDSTGDQVISSDETLKMNLRDVTYSVSDIAKCRAVTFDWKDGHGHSAGSIAQDWKPLIPELVHGEEGGMTLAYGQIALVNSILEAREIERLKERVAELEQQLKMRN